MGLQKIGLLTQSPVVRFFEGAFTVKFIHKLVGGFNPTLKRDISFDITLGKLGIGLDQLTVVRGLPIRRTNHLTPPER